MQHEGVKVDQGTPISAPLRPAVVAVPGKVDNFRLPRFFVVRHRLPRWWCLVAVEVVSGGVGGGNGVGT